MYTPVPSLPLAAYPVPPVAQPAPALALAVAPEPEPLTRPKVGLVLSDGAHLTLSMDDAAADAFRSLAQELSQGLK